MKNDEYYGHEAELFDKVCENALNGIDPEKLSDREWAIHRKWVADNWTDLEEREGDPLRHLLWLRQSCLDEICEINLKGREEK